MLKSENHVTIQGWMCNEFELKGNELLVYALIYGFSQDGESSFFGGRKYIAETFNISLPTVDKALQGLLNKGYIIKQASDDNQTPDSYYADTNMVVKKLYGGSKETLLNNIYNNKNTINKTISKDIVQNLVDEPKPKKKNLYQKCMDMIDEYTNNTILWEYLSQFLKICLENSREAGRPFYQNMWKSKLTKLSELSDNTDMQIKIVKQTLDNGWSNFYEYKGDRKKTGNTAHDIEKLYGGMNERADKEHMTYGEEY